MILPLSPRIPACKAASARHLYLRTGKDSVVAKKSLVTAALLLLLPVVAQAQGAHEEVQLFYQALKKAPAAMDAAGVAFGDKLRAALAAGSPENIAALKISLVDVLLTVHRIRGESRVLKVLPSPSAKELYVAVDNFVKQQERTVVESGPEFLRIAADGTLTTADKRAQVEALADRNHQGTAAAQALLHKALVAFAREHELLGEQTVELLDFKTPDHACKVQMPPVTETKNYEANGIKNTYHLAEDKNGVFMVSYADIAPAGEGEAALQKRLQEGKAGMIKQLSLKVTNDRPVTLAGKYPGRDLEGDLPDRKNVTRIRMFLVNGRLYQMWVVGPAPWVASTEATRFLQSLELLK